MFKSFKNNLKLIKILMGTNAMKQFVVMIQKDYFATQRRRAIAPVEPILTKLHVVNKIYIK